MSTDIDWVALSHLPTVSLDGASLDRLELQLGGVPQAVRLTLPGDVAAAAAEAGGLQLTDPEGAPIAVLHRLSATPVGTSAVTLLIEPGAAAPLRPPAHGVFRGLRRPAREVAGTGPHDAVVLRGLPTLTNVTLARRHFGADAGKAVDSGTAAGTGTGTAAGTGMLVALVGTGTPVGVDAAGLLRSSRALAAELGVEVLAVPLPTVPDENPATWETDARRVLSAYGIDDPLLLAPTRDAGVDDLPDHAARELRRLQPGPRQCGALVLFTGLSGSGKSTVARGLVDALEELGTRAVTLLDGDDVRRMLSAGLGFSREDRDLNVRRIGYVGSLVARHGGIAVCAPIAPYDETRAAVRAMAEAVGEFVLVHVATPLEVCEARDRKGLYAKARAGLIPQFTGISDRYEPPSDADVVVDTDQLSADDAVTAVVAELRRRGLVWSADA